MIAQRKQSLYSSLKKQYGKQTRTHKSINLLTKHEVSQNFSFILHKKKCFPSHIFQFPSFSCLCFQLNTNTVLGSIGFANLEKIWK